MGLGHRCLMPLGGKHRIGCDSWSRQAFCLLAKLYLELSPHFSPLYVTFPSFPVLSAPQAEPLAIT